VELVLEGLLARNKRLVVIEGQARGADTMAGDWAEEAVESLEDVDHWPFPADWEQFGKAAGPIRNRQMLTEGKPDVVIAFHDFIPNSKGTKDMVEIAKEAGVPTYVVSHG
jgi:hypothetical protein